MVAVAVVVLTPSASCTPHHRWVASLAR
jgi:hypothetical protein